VTPAIAPLRPRRGAARWGGRVRRIAAPHDARGRTRPSRRHAMLAAARSARGRARRPRARRARPSARRQNLGRDACSVAGFSAAPLAIFPPRRMCPAAPFGCRRTARCRMRTACGSTSTSTTVIVANRCIRITYNLQCGRVHGAAAAPSCSRRHACAASMQRTRWVGACFLIHGARIAPQRECAARACDGVAADASGGHRYGSSPEKRSVPFATFLLTPFCRSTYSASLTGSVACVRQTLGPT
jgi:hypothetical protein